MGSKVYGMRVCVKILSREGEGEREWRKKATRHVNLPLQRAIYHEQGEKRVSR